MEDEKIVDLYWERDERALAVTSVKYGGYCTQIAFHILEDIQDTEECVNDTWMNAWNSIPPNRPALLGAYLGKITRNLAFNRRKRLLAQKRGSGQLELVLDELGEIVSGKEDVEATLDRKLLSEAIQGFLRGLPREKRGIFLCRYWYALNIKEVSRQYGMTENSVSVNLNRIRKHLRRYLEERGFTL